MDTREIIKKVRKIEIKTRRLSNHIFGGEYHSAFKGKGMAFSEVREYQYGDSIRDIDWNVTARYNEPFVKVFEEERELTMMLMIDVSSSCLFGSNNYLKSEIIIEICATLAFSAIQNNDKVGAILFSNEIELYIPPKKGKTHVLRVIRELLDFKPKNKGTDFTVALDFLNKVIKKRAIVFALSDFFCSDYKTSLQISSKRHDINGIRVYDKREEEIPNIGLVQIYDTEKETYQLVNTHSKKYRYTYNKDYTNAVNYFKTTFQKGGIGTIEIETNDNYVTKLYSFFKTM